MTVTNGVALAPAPKNITDIKSDAELFDDFLASLDLDTSNLTDTESIDGEIKLNKYLWVVKQKESELSRCRTIAKDSIRSTSDWLNEKETQIQNAIDWLTGQMKNYLITKDIKSLSLPNGTIGMRKQPEAIEVVDESSFISDASPDLLRHVPESYEPDLKAIKALIKETGEIPKGIELKAQNPKFYYKLNGSM
jgi:hypothetical protein